ncbi:MAG: hypothetical protein IPM34_11880 [Saprospiraceae bacterium]|nr:hypothetical protein [Saprospiraceae bacterium]
MVLRTVHSTWLILFAAVLLAADVTSDIDSKSVETLTQETLPLQELGKGLWKNYSGGLYPGGQNLRPLEHDSAGIRLGLEISPLDTFGNSELKSGKIVLLSIGMSNCTQEFSVFKTMADSFKRKNPKLHIVDGAQGGQTASVIKDPNANFWTVVNQRLYQQQTHPRQVQAIWLKEANANPNQAFPKHAEDLHKDLKSIVILLKQKFPNLKQVFLSSRTYAGYANTPLNPEPYAYETGFSVKWLIEDQITGDTTLTFRGDHARAPWLSWGPYLWAQGEKARLEDSLFWLRIDFAADGTHPSNAGRLKVANLLLRFFSNDPATSSWFIDQKLTIVSNFKKQSLAALNLQLSQNPFAKQTTLQWNMPQSGIAEILVVPVHGNKIFFVSRKHYQSGLQFLDLNKDLLEGNPSPGCYVIYIRTSGFSDQVKCLIL